MDGRRWESLALSFLQRQGLILVERNFSAKCGEIDLIMCEGATLVFVEVRQRKPGRFGTAAGTIDAAKRRKITRTASLYIATHAQFRGHCCRVDVIAYDTNDETFSLPLWLKGAFA